MTFNQFELNEIICVKFIWSLERFMVTDIIIVKNGFFQTWYLSRIKVSKLKCFKDQCLQEVKLQQNELFKGKSITLQFVLLVLDRIWCFDGMYKPSTWICIPCMSYSIVSSVLYLCYLCMYLWMIVIHNILFLRQFRFTVFPG